MGERSATASDLAGRCTRCWMLASHCICPRIPRLESDVRFLVLRHAKERWRSTNTSRVAALALPTIQIVDYGLRDAPPLDLGLIPNGAFVLFPGLASRPAPERDAQGDRPVTIVVPDGNWNQAGRLARRLLGHPGLRPLALSGLERAAHTLRRSRSKEQLSTIEAMAGALEWLGEPDNAGALRAVYRVMVEASVAGRGGRSRELLGPPR